MCLEPCAVTKKIMKIHEKQTTLNSRLCICHATQFISSYCAQLSIALSANCYWRRFFLLFALVRTSCRQLLAITSQCQRTLACCLCQSYFVIYLWCIANNVINSSKKKYVAINLWKFCGKIEIIWHLFIILSISECLSDRGLTNTTVMCAWWVSSSMKWKKLWHYVRNLVTRKQKLIEYAPLTENWRSDTQLSS